MSRGANRRRYIKTLEWGGRRGRPAYDLQRAMLRQALGERLTREDREALAAWERRQPGGRRRSVE
jgi:hypothetical protein